jgi:hypothetical protein
LQNDQDERDDDTFHCLDEELEGRLVDELGQDQKDVSNDQDKSDKDEVDCDLFLVKVQNTIVW